MQILSISELEKISGLPRTTIYHYLKEGLLPAAQRVGGGPAVYGEGHVARLKEIRSLKQDGLTLEEIGRRFEETGDPNGTDEVDLIARQVAETRRLILEDAARQFAAKGYRGTRMADVAASTGIGPLTLYRYFPAKRELFIEVVETLVERTLDYTESLILAEPDLVKRHMMRVIGFLGVRNISPEMLTFVRAEALGTDEATHELFQKTYRRLTRALLEDLAVLRSLGTTPPRTTDDMMAYALLGLLENSSMRLSWDEKYSVEDYLWTNLEAYLGIRAVYLERTTVKREIDTYASMVEELAAHPPFAF
jgi:AcrR family transcriptional regulator/predicted DNA-binding transcriptional regulator AlpA